MNLAHHQRIAVIGLGRFGMSLARRLSAHGAEVIAIDRNRNLVDELRDEVLRQVAANEESAEATRVEKGEKAMGMKWVKKQFWGAMPGKEDLFGRNPTVSASSRWDRVEAQQRRQDFLAAYRSARERWLAGEKDVVFPAGTWLLKRRFGVRCEGDIPQATA